jgi:retron-type reverse transcriptase
VISPLLANIYLHYAFDLWVNVWRKKWAHGEVAVIRYADDGVPRARKVARLSSAQLLN